MKGHKAESSDSSVKRALALDYKYDQFLVLIVSPPVTRPTPGGARDNGTDSY